MEIEASKRRKPRRVTLNDVAKEAGVSVQTASHVMAGNMTVRLPESTRERIIKAAASVGYEPNRLARAMRTGKTNMVSLWMPLDRITYNYLRNLREFGRLSRQDNYDLMIVGLEASMAYGAEGRMPQQWPVDGMISVDSGRAMKVFRENPLNNSIPLVILGHELFKNSDSVSWDVMAGMASVTSGLLDQGLKKIVHATPTWVIQNYPREQRRRGYSETMQTHGLEPVLVPMEDESSRISEQSFEKFVAENGVPEAVVCFTDSIAIGVIRALTARGIPIPDECKVWGFNDYPEAEDYKIPLSSVRVPVEELADNAWNWLTERIQDPTIEPRQVIRQMTLIQRDSG